MNSLSTCEKRSAADLSDIRNGILLCLQDPGRSLDLRSTIDRLRAFERWAASSSPSGAATLAGGCISVLQAVDPDDRQAAETRLRSVLDLLVLIDAELVETELDGNLFEDISSFVDESFEKLTGTTPQVIEAADPGFELDAETMEIFHAEAGDLLSSVAVNLDRLTERSENREALWDLRRAIHTLKGAVGLVGLREAAVVAHKIEDLLGVLVENRWGADPVTLAALNASVEYLNTAATFGDTRHDVPAICDQLDQARHECGLRLRTAASEGNTVKPKASGDGLAGGPSSSPVIRVSLDRLNDLQSIASDLALTRTRTAEVFEIVAPSIGEEQRATIEALLASQARLSKTLVDRLGEIRLVRFGTLANRLTRAVNVTCQEEGKKAEVVIENEDAEVDTLIIDAMVEPLLHLLRNAVAHGIEPPDMRRMIAKPERGRITIRVDDTDEAVILSVTDDGRGIDAAKLKEKALAAGSISQQLADDMTDEEATELMFLRGVTTAETLSMNAGRGIGMNIVKESVESRGGRLSILTQPQVGTTFIMKFPTAPHGSTGQNIETVQVATHKPVEIMESGPAVDDAGPAGPRAAPAPETLASEIVAEETASDADTEAETVTATEPIEALAPTGSSTAAPAKTRILVIDDSPLMRQTIVKVMERAGWTAISADNGHEALRLLQVPGDRPDVIITDLEMPQHDGYALIKDLKRHSELRNIPVIMLTSRSERMHRDRALALGAARFFTKPLDSTELRAAVAELLNIIS